jgi:SAM-dependent methyltransferase
MGLDVRAQVLALKRDYPDVHDCLDLDRVEAWIARIRSGGLYGDDFGPKVGGGRGASYVKAQRATFNRAPGIAAILEVIAGRRRAESDIVLDLLGGDGLVNRVATALGLSDLRIMTCDGSPFMVESAWAAGVPALLQYAQFPLFRGESVGGAFLAYGSHHIGPEDRADTVKEVRAMLQPGGVFLLHDFLSGSAMERWFGEVVDTHSITGHRYSHFDRTEIRSYLETAGFTDIEVVLMDDPFVVQAPTAAEAELAMGRHLVDMYGLTSLIDEYGEEGAYRRARELSTAIFRDEVADPGSGGEPRYSKVTGAWTLALGRKAIVGYGIA